MPPIRQPERQERRWREDYQRALEGHAPGSFDADDWVATLEEIGVEYGYIEPPSGEDEMSARIRLGAGKGTDADRELLRLRDVAHGEGKGS